MGAENTPAGPGGRIVAVEPDSLADELGLQPGDELLSINGRPLRDVIDVQFYAADEQLELLVRHGDESTLYEVEWDAGEPLGLAFDQPTFDGIRRCTNRCEFCFVTQMPPGLRPSLYVRDDDYRHSFLFGSYVTLTNLDEIDWQRLAEQRLSPLYVSVQATEPELRRRMLRAPGAPSVLAQLRRLAGLGIEVHTQIVLTPGVNDGMHLERSIADLVELYPAVASVSVVPVGLTRFHRGGCRIYTPDEMAAVVAQVERWQEQLLPRLGARFVYLSDEWYLRLGLPVPEAAAYDDLDLTENGVGLVRRFLDGVLDGAALEACGLQPGDSRVILVTGTLFAPLLREAARTWGREQGIELEVLPVVNHFFGETVTVAGLLTAADVIDQLQGRELGDRVLLPAAMFGGPEGQSLDGMLPEQVAQAVGRPATICPPA